MKRRAKILLATAAAVGLLAAGTAFYYEQRGVGTSSVGAGSVPFGWQDEGVRSDAYAGGLVKTTTHGYDATELGRVSLVVVTPLPFLDLASLVDKKVAQVLADHKATSTATGGGSLRISGLAAPYREFAVHAKDGTWDGRLVRASYECPTSGDFVAAIAFGVTDKLGRPLPTFGQAREMVEASTCS